MPRAATAAARSGQGPARKRPPAPRRAPAQTKRSLRIVPRGGAAARPAGLGAGLLDRLLRGRAWIACIGALLAGVVFLNVSLLEVNRQITASSERAAELRRENAQMRLRVAELASSERIQQVAAERGFVLPEPGAVEYLRAEPRVDARRAAERITAPSGDEAPPPQQQASELPQAPATQATP